MKKILLTILCASPILLHAQQKFDIKGKIGNWSAPARVYLVYMAGDQRVVDSVTMKDGAFTIGGAVPDVTMAWLMLDRKGIGYNQMNPSNSDYTGLNVYNEKIMVRSADSMKNIKVENSPLNDEGVRFYALLNEGMTKANALKLEWESSPAEKKNNISFQQEWKKRSEAAAKEASAAKMNYVRQKPASYYSLMALADLVNEKKDADELSRLYNTIAPEWRNSKTGKQLAADIAALRNTAIGKKAPLFTQPDKDGKPVSLSQYKGKYVLVDFWASWCWPCRGENPNVVKAYNTYHPKGLEILGVSLDDTNYKNAWLEAIQKDGLVWAQVSDLKGFKNEAAQLYAVKSIPQNFLINPDGVIVAVNLRGEELGKKLETLFGK